MKAIQKMPVGDEDNPLTESVPVVTSSSKKIETEFKPTKPAHLRTWKETIEHLAPGYFAFVMSSGILSIGAHLMGWVLFSKITLWLSAAAYVILWGLHIGRTVKFPSRIRHDLRDPSIAFTFFTVVAGTDVLAVRFFYEGMPEVGLPLETLGVTLWFIFGYLLPWQVLMTRDGKPILARANGTWFVWAVASQSQTIALAQVQQHVSTQSTMSDIVGLLAVLTWSVGITLYAGLSLFVLLRVIIHGITPHEFEPSYWVSMGALAIAVVAGTSIVTMESTPMIDATKGLIASTAVIFWCFCIWLYPMLFGAGIWRHMIHKVPIGYTPAYWTMVFPLAMIGVASINLGRADSLPLAEHLGLVFLFIAILIWCLVLAGLIHRIVVVTRNSRVVLS